MKFHPSVEHYFEDRALSPELHAWVVPLVMGRARIVIGSPTDQWFLDGW
jgi:hypothetical protein